jgi:hypothetical protein
MTEYHAPTIHATCWLTAKMWLKTVSATTEYHAPPIHANHLAAIILRILTSARMEETVQSTHAMQSTTASMYPQIHFATMGWPVPMVHATSRAEIAVTILMMPCVMTASTAHLTSVT